MNSGKGLVAALVTAAFVSVASCPVPVAAQKDAPTRKSARAPGKGASLDAAVAELKREYAAYLKDPDAAPPRSASDYFIDHPQTVAPGALFAVLEKPMPGHNRQVAYVKWQLLSALPETLDAPAVRRLFKVYQNAPMPAPRYGLSPHEKRKLDAAVAGARPQDDVQLTAKLEEAVERAYAANAPIIAYRDELYRRLPLGRDKFFAGLRDGHERMSVAAQRSALMEALIEELQGWALSGDATNTEVREIAELVGKLRFLASPPYYASAGVKKGKVGWVTKTETLFTKKKLADLHKLLLDAASMRPPPAPDADGIDPDADDAGTDGKRKQVVRDKKVVKDKKAVKDTKAGTDS